MRSPDLRVGLPAESSICRGHVDVHLQASVMGKMKSLLYDAAESIQNMDQAAAMRGIRDSLSMCSKFAGKGKVGWCCDFNSRCQCQCQCQCQCNSANVFVFLFSCITVVSALFRYDSAVQHRYIQSESSSGHHSKRRSSDGNSGSLELPGGLSSRSVKKIFSALDSNSNGRLELKELRRFYKKKMGMSDSEAKAR